MFEGFIGTKCIVRSSASGVWHGMVAEATTSGGRAVVRLTEARRLWRWEGRALDCSGLAIHGPTTARIAGTVASIVVADVCELQQASAESSARIEAVVPWNG